MDLFDMLIAEEPEGNALKHFNMEIRNLILNGLSQNGQIFSSGK